MARAWTCHWQFRYWRPDVNREGQPLRSSGSNSFRKRGVTVGDTMYVVSLRAGQLYLGGRMTVKQIISRPEAVRLWNSDNLYDAGEWAVDPEEGGTLLDLHRRLHPAVTKRLRFESKDGPKKPCFISDTELDNQATRGVRQLTPESAALLDRIIAVTDRLPKPDQVMTITEELLASKQPVAASEEFRLPDELPAGMVYNEGSARRIEVNRYERDPQARLACIAAHGTRCVICGFSFAATYGPTAAGYIHVHHLRPLSQAGGGYVVDPVEDLRPVCPNCHAVLHLDSRCRSIDEVREFLAQQRHAKPGASPNGGPVEPFGHWSASGGPPSVS